VPEGYSDLAIHQGLFSEMDYDAYQ